MRRWTDGKSWSASRVSGSFLTYREMEGKRGGGAFAPPLAASRAGKTPDSQRGSDSDLEMAGDDGHDGYRYKPDGLMKQSFSITTSSGNHLHLISYYARSHPNAGGLNNPTSDPQLRHIRPQKGMYPESTVHEQQSIPPVTRAPMVSAPYSTVPQMAGYARAQPTPHQMAYAQPGFGWAPQPPMYNGQQYSYQYGPQGPPPPNGHSPLSYSQSAQMATSQPPTSQPQQHHSPHNSQYNGSPAPNDNLGSRPPPQYHRSSSSGSGPAQYGSNPSSGISQYNSSQSPGTPSQPPIPYQQMKQQIQQQPPPQPLSRPSSANPSATPPMSKIDPRLIAPSSLMQQQSSHTDPSRTPSPMPPKHENSHNTPVHANGTPQASTIPSIGSIMNSSSTDNADAKSDRSGSRSPGGSKRSNAHDIPNDKVGFNEDARALRVLDRVFKT